MPARAWGFKSPLRHAEGGAKALLTGLPGHQRSGSEGRLSSICHHFLVALRSACSSHCAECWSGEVQVADESVGAALDRGSGVRCTRDVKTCGGHGACGPNRAPWLGVHGTSREAAGPSDEGRFTGSPLLRRRGPCEMEAVRRHVWRGSGRISDRAGGRRVEGARARTAHLRLPAVVRVPGDCRGDGEADQAEGLLRRAAAPAGMVVTRVDGMSYAERILGRIHAPRPRLDARRHLCGDRRRRAQLPVSEHGYTSTTSPPGSGATRACGCGDRVTEALTSRLIKRVGTDRHNAVVSREGSIQR